MTVEIDETAILRRKYNVGRISASKTQWLVGGICREKGKIFLERIPNRSQATRNDLVVRHVEAGITIITDCWAGYNWLLAQGFPHDTVNHSIHFLNPSDNNITTQRIENGGS
uniref:DDE_Tnp_IS1595 domain-containing protein n=1 Tax=Anopheles stephensi TaxID=30069 RepID=A0A182YS01_ANOST